MIEARHDLLYQSPTVGLLVVEHTQAILFMKQDLYVPNHMLALRKMVPAPTPPSEAGLDGIDGHVCTFDWEVELPEPLRFCIGTGKDRANVTPKGTKYPTTGHV